MRVFLAGEFLRGHLRACSRVEPIAPRISQQVERKHGGHHRQSWKNDHVRRVKEVAARIVQHGAPAGNGREDAEAEEAQRASRVDRTVALRYE